MTTKEKYELFDKTKINEKVLGILKNMQESSKNFTDESVNSKIDSALDKLIENFRANKPEALLTLPEAKKEVKKEKEKAIKKNEGKDFSDKKDTDDKTGLPKKDTLEERKDIIKEESETEKEARDRAKKELEKEKEKAKDEVESQIEKLNRIIMEDPALRGFNQGSSALGGKGLGGKSNPLIDAERKALPRGSRVSQKGWKNQYGASDGGRKYYENRENRTDRKSPDYETGKPYLEKGGSIYDGMSEREFLKQYDGVNVFTENPSDYFDIKKLSSSNDNKIDNFIEELKKDGYVVKKKSYSDFTSVMGVRRKMANGGEVPKGGYKAYANWDTKNNLGVFDNHQSARDFAIANMGKYDTIVFEDSEGDTFMTTKDSDEKYIDYLFFKLYPDGKKMADGGMMAHGGKIAKDYAKDKIYFMYEKFKLGMGDVFATILPENPNGGKIKYGLHIRSVIDNPSKSQKYNTTIFELDSPYYPAPNGGIRDAIGTPYSDDKFKAISMGNHLLVVELPSKGRRGLSDLIYDILYKQNNYDINNVNKEDKNILPNGYPNFFLNDLFVFKGNMFDLMRFMDKIESEFKYKGNKLYKDKTPYKITIIWNIPEIKNYDNKITTPATYIPIVEIENELEGNSKKYADGGEVEGVDLFEDYDDQPDEVQAILANYEMEDNDYETLQNLKAELESIGYTMEFGLDAEPYDLRKIGEKGKSEFYAKGGKLNTEVVLTENRSNGAKWRGVVKPFMMKSIEQNQYGGGFKRYEIDIYDDKVEREPSKEELKEANEFFDKVGGRFAHGGEMPDGYMDDETLLHEFKETLMDTDDLQISIKEYYVNAFPTDDEGFKIEPDANFAGLNMALTEGDDVYKYLGVTDSLVRERVFEKLSEILGVDYDVVYNMWLRSDKYDKGGQMADGGKMDEYGGYKVTFQDNTEDKLTWSEYVYANSEPQAVLRAIESLSRKYPTYHDFSKMEVIEIEEGEKYAKGGETEDYYENLAVYVRGRGEIYRGTSMKKALAVANDYKRKNSKAKIVVVDDKIGDEYDLNGNLTGIRQKWYFEYAKGGMMADGGEVEPKIYEINDGYHLYYFYGDNKAQVLKYFKMVYHTNKYEQNISIKIMTGSRLKHLEESEEYDYIEDARVVDNINESDEMAHGGGIPYKPYGKTKGRFKLTYEVEGEEQSEIRESLEEATDSARRYVNPKLGYTNVHIYDESGKEYFFADGGMTFDGIGFIPMDLEEKLMITAKWGGTNIKGVIGILNAMIDSNITDEDLRPKPTKTGSAFENAVAKKTKEIWAKIEPQYKGDFRGNMYYSTIRRLVERSTTSDEILKRYKPFRKYQKNSFASNSKITEGGYMADGGYTESGEKLYEIANNMSDKEFQEAYRNLSEKEKDLYESLLRLGDEEKIALVTVLNESKKPKYDKVTWDLHRYAKGGQMTDGGGFGSWESLTIEKMQKDFPFKLNQLNRLLKDACGDRDDAVITNFESSWMSKKYDTFANLVYEAGIYLKSTGSDNVSPSGTYHSQQGLSIIFYLRQTYRSNGSMSSISIDASKTVAGGMEKYKSIDVENYHDIYKYISAILRDNPKNNLGNFTYAKGGEMAKVGITPQLNDKVHAKAQEILKAEGITENISQKQFNQAYDKAIKEFGYSPAYFKKVMREFGPEYPDDDDSEFGDFMADGGKTDGKYTEYEMVVLSKDADGKSHKYRFLISARNMDEANQIATDGWHSEFGDMGETFDKVMTDSKYRMDYGMADGGELNGNLYRVGYLKVYENDEEGDTVYTKEIYGDSEEDVSSKFKKIHPKHKIEFISKYADGGEVDFSERMAKMRSAYENLNMIVKSRIAVAIGIDRAISIMENDYSIDPFGLITSAVRSGLLELDEINKDLVNEAVYEAERVTDDYRDSGQGIGGSDMTYFTKNVLDSAGYKTGFVNNRLTRVDADGNELVIDKYEMNY